MSIALAFALWAPSPASAQNVDLDTHNPAGGFRIIGAGYGQIVGLNSDDTAAAFSIGLAYSDPRFDLALQIRKGSSPGLLAEQKQFARFILTPTSASTSVDATTSLRLITNTKNTQTIGITGYAQIGNAEWEARDEQEILTGSATALALGAAVDYRISGTLAAPAEKDPYRVSLTFSGGPTIRILSGDVAADDRLREHALGRKQTVFVGLETVAALQIKGVQIAARIPILAGDVPGLTRLQLIVSVVLADSVRIF